LHDENSPVIRLVSCHWEWPSLGRLQVFIQSYPKLKMQWNYLMRRTRLERWASSGSVAFLLRNTEVLPNIEGEIYPNDLLNAAASRGDAGI
jgi:hypothetical protein